MLAAGGRRLAACGLVRSSKKPQAAGGKQPAASMQLQIN